MTHPVHPQVVLQVTARICLQLRCGKKICKGMLIACCGLATGFSVDGGYEQMKSWLEVQNTPIIYNELQVRDLAARMHAVCLALVMRLGCVCSQAG